MIVPMKHAAILALANRRDEVLGHLRELGLLHVTVGPTDTPRVRDAQRACAETEQAIAVLKRAKKNKARKTTTEPRDHGVAPPATAADVLALDRELSELETTRERLEREERRFAPFGEFDPASAQSLIASGIPVRLFKIHTKKLPPKLDAPFFLLGRDGAETFGVAFGDTLPADCAGVGLPQKSPAETRAELAETRRAIARITGTLALHAPALLPRLVASLAEDRDHATFSTAWESMGSHGAIDSIQGFLPAEDLPKLQSVAAWQGWGLATRDPQPGDNVPSLLRPPSVFRPILELFKALNITPAYEESDVSIPFYIFFTLFFAMIIGDAGYGFIFLLATLGARFKLRKKMPRPVFILGLVFSCATVLWGVATATYFGIPSTALPAPMLHPLARWPGDQNNIIQLCLVIGATHLSIARVWNAVLLFPNRKFLGQLGWAGTLWGIYLVVCSLVIQGFRQPAFTLPLLGASVLLVVCFTLGRGEFKTNGIELGMLPLNLFGAMGDIISYIRLFAVGLASVQVAENFNLMASGLTLPIWLKIPAMLLILALAHGINLAMGGLSILVHAVRLNTLEFSNAKGVSWGGFAYRPFGKPNPQPRKETP